MSTEYTLLENAPHGMSIEVWEHSNTFDLAVPATLGEGLIVKDEWKTVLTDLSSEQLATIALKMLQVVGYWEGENFVEKQLTDFRRKHGGF